MTNKLREKDFLLIPISDGYWDTFARGITQHGHNVLSKIPWLEYKESLPQQGQAGTHWSLLLVDCRTAEIKGRYYDSQIDGFERQDQLNQRKSYVAAWQVLKGVRTVLDTMRPNFYVEITDERYEVEFNAPEQEWNNRSGNVELASACGPFVWEMSREIVQYIIDIREDIQHGTLPHDYPIQIYCSTEFNDKKNWDSMQTRRTIRSLIVRELMTRAWLNKTTDWHDPNGWQAWLVARNLPMTWFYNPRALATELNPQFGRVLM
jgi:hypothetical protein